MRAAGDSTLKTTAVAAPTKTGNSESDLVSAASRVLREAQLARHVLDDKFDAFEQKSSQERRLRLIEAAGDNAVSSLISKALVSGRMESFICAHDKAVLPVLSTDVIYFSFGIVSMRDVVPLFKDPHKYTQTRQQLVSFYAIFTAFLKKF